MIKIVSDKTSPGYSATVKLYNTGNKLLDFLKPASSGENFFFDYMNNQCRIDIYAGYWQHELVGDIDPQKKYGYDLVFTGYVNSSARYRNGVDDVFELYCFHTKIDKLNGKSEVKKALNELIMNKQGFSEGDIERLLKDSYSTYQGIEMSLEHALRKTIMAQAPEMSSRFNVAARAINYVSDRRDSAVALASYSTDTGVPVVNRSSSGWFSMQFIKQTSIKDLESGVRVNNEDTELQNEVKNKKMRFSINQDNDKVSPGKLRSEINRLISASGISMSYYGYLLLDGMVFLYFYRPEAVTTGKYKGSVSSKDKITITNFQNFLEAPAVDGTGSITAKMMFNKNCHPGMYLEFKWDEEVKSFNSISKGTEGMSLNASLAAQTTSLIAGQYNLQASSLSQTDGYLFNKAFKILNVEHRLSTHGSDWSTTVKTVIGDLLK